ncbi:MAG: YiiX/YebB-like N1pC/P60 family cysteine hydrolase [Dysgonomonas sp.]|nr:YiiX/YebB-like N1pC/P60 family cysteine hydrolase [Dysgonomonas sp.]
MESKYGQSQVKLIFILGLLFLLGCSKAHKTENKVQLPDDVRSGDIICRLGNGFFSSKFKSYSIEEKLYSHVGIAWLSNDSVFVIHAEASELTGVGHVKREYISDFLNEIKIWGVYRLEESDSISTRIAENANCYYLRNTPFDLEFDAMNDDEVYCTELVANAVNKSLGDSLIKPNLVLGDKSLYTIDGVYLLPRIRVVQKIVN